jgi:hypothetical protein
VALETVPSGFALPVQLLVRAEDAEDAEKILDPDDSGG